MARLSKALVFLALIGAPLVLAQPQATPEPAAAAGGSSSSGAAPVVAPGAAPAPLSGGKKALLGSALRELTSVLGRPGGAGPAGGRGKVQGVVSSILSLALENNANGLFAQPQGIFDFGNSGAASIYWPQGNIGAVRNFANVLMNATTTKDLAAIAPAVGGALNQLCAPETFVPQQLVAGGCKSPEVELRMVPAECLLTPSTGELVCRPAYLMLEQRPAECSLPHMTPAQWEGRSCAAFSLIGPKIDYAVGYQQFSQPLPNPTPIANALLSPLRGAGSKLLEKVGALAARRVMGGAGIGGGVGGGASTTTTAAVDGGAQQQG